MKKFYPLFLLGILVICAGCQSAGNAGFNAGAYAKKYWTSWEKNPPRVKLPKGMKAKEADAKVEAHKKCLELFAPHILAEYEQIDKTFNWKKETYARMMALGFKEEKPAPHECTSWVIMPDLLKNRSLIIHKTRDSMSDRLCVMRWKVPGKYAWLSLGNRGYFTSNMGINSAGVVVVMNNGGRTRYNNTTGMGTTLIARILLENCGNAESAVKLLGKIIKKGAYLHGKSGSIWFIGDSKKAYIAENNAKVFAVEEVRSGFAVRANSCHIPAMALCCTQSVRAVVDNFRREKAIWNELIPKVFQKKDKTFSVADNFAASRSRDIDGGKDKVYPPFGKATNSAATFVIDREFPTELSTVWMACGPQRHTVYIPFAVTLKNIPEKLLTGEFSDAVFVRSKAKGMDSPVDEFTTLEKTLIKNHQEAVAKARAVLRKKYVHGRAEAAAIMAAAFEKNWKLVNKK